MNIVILGDTWGIVPTHLYRCPTIQQRTHYNANYDADVLNWLDYLLLAKGHAVYNRSWGGSDNYYQLTQLETCLAAGKLHGFKIDLVIWFHGELLRGYDADKIKEQGVEKYLDNHANILYSYATEIKQSYPETMWAIIGATGALRKNALLDWADLKIDNMRDVIFKTATPECHSYYGFYLPNRWDSVKEVFSEQEIAAEKEKGQEIERLQESTNHFYNSIHPGTKAYSSIVEQIIRVFNL